MSCSSCLGTGRWNNARCQLCAGTGRTPTMDSTGRAIVGIQLYVSFAKAGPPPVGARVILANKDAGTCTVTEYRQQDFWDHWAPCPRFPE